MSDARLGRGQAIVEFSLVVVIFVMMLFAVFDFGRVIWANNALANAAREAARYAIVHGGSKTNDCPVGPPVTEPATEATVIPLSSPSCPHPSPSKKSIVDTANSFAVAGGAPIIVEVCYGAGCSGNTDTDDNARGTPITVRISSSVDLVAGRLLGQNTFAVTAKSTMLVNH